MQLLLAKILPILILILLGMAIRKIKLISDETVEGLKQLIIKVALPGVLFTAFATMKLEIAYILLFVLVFVFCFLLYGLGEIGHRFFPALFPSRYTSGFLTGFEFGMIGVGLFAAIWGLDKLPVIMLVGFGHELFIWFVYMPLISDKGTEKEKLSDVIKSFVKNPPIIGIAIGIVFNLLNLYKIVGDTVFGGSIYSTIAFLTPLTSPLILIVIGYSMTFGAVKIKEALVYIFTRWILVFSIGSFLLWIISSFIYGLDPLFTIAFYAFIILPPPYLLPLLMDEKSEGEYFSQLLVYSTVISFIGYVILYGVSISLN